ncbi:tetratricopeptide repeat protein [Stieleria sp. ICT_E10.1]|uniref:tetratricopeptide repeat protein n=1 Tax=Stieleria sedimenti TaxID=2976331 RepID=UPI0021808A4C|nr:tetratricopeptide repeat protein [Stieleria sedimenti]MCS7466519.1 tetratricopeptide repeat protein [Stieleria sedimenti]
MATLFSLSLRVRSIDSKIVSVRFVACFLMTLLATVSPLSAQPPDQERQVADRFLDVLLRNPQPGTALDRVYDFHVQNQSLDRLLQSLDDANSGHKQMVHGLIQLKRADSSAAVASLQKAETLLDGNVSVSHQLAKALAAEGENKKAIDAFQRAITKQPDRRQAPDIYLDLGRLHCRIGQTGRAITLWNQLVDQYPDDHSMAEKVAAALVAQQAYEPALDHYRRLAEQAKTAETRVGYQIKVADLTARIGQTEQARDQLQSILDRLRPGSWLHADVRSRLERSYLSAGDTDALADYYRHQTKRFPDDVTLPIRLAEILAGSGRNEEAVPILSRVIEKTPHHVDARLALVEILEGEGRADEAARHIEQLIAIDPANPDYRLRLGEACLGDLTISLPRRREAAREAWNQLANVKSDDASLLATIARHMQSIEASDRAVELYRRAIDVAPDDPHYRESLGELLHHLGRHDEAIAAWQSIADGQRRSAESLIRLATVFGSFKLTDLALQCWRQAAELDLSFEQRLRYIRVLSEANRHDAAFAELETASGLAENADERERLIRRRIEALRAAGKLSERIAQVSVEEPTRENQRFLALLFLASGQPAAASLSIDAALNLDPENVAILRDAVDIADALGRLSTAATHLETLAQLDKRFQVDHLGRLVQIHEQLGELDQASRAAQAMIDANPASPDSYRLYARIAFAAGQDQAGENALRRAIVVDPRGIDARVTLARRLAKRYETLAAIDLLWQAIAHERRITARTDLVQQLVPLYARRGEIDRLVSRLERVEIDGLDPKSKSILIASVWTLVKDFRQAHTVIKRMLGKHPRDVKLLQAMVDHLSQSGDLFSAVSYQRRLVNVENTPSNQSRLSSLELEAGLITQAEVTMREMKATKDPTRMASIIRRIAITDPEQAAELCRVALENNRNLWDIRLVWAQLLLLSDAPERGEHLAQAAKVAGEVAALKLDDDLPSISGFAPPPQSTSASRASATTLSPSAILSNFVVVRGSSGSSLTLRGRRPTQIFNDRDHFPASAAASLQNIVLLNERRITSRQNNGSKSYSFAFGSNFLGPENYFQAHWIARCVQILADQELASLHGQSVTAKQLIDKRFAAPPIDSADIAAFRNVILLHSIQNSLDDTDTLPPEAIIWRVAQLDPAGDHPALAELLARRSRIRQVLEKTPRQKISPLDDSKLEILSIVCQTHQTLATKRSAPIETIRRDLQLRQNLVAESRVAGKDYPFAETLDQSVAPSNYHRTVAEIQAALWENHLTLADEKAADLVQIARSSRPGESMTDQVVPWIVSPNSDAERAFVIRHRQLLADAWIAHFSRWSLLFRQGLPPSELFGGEQLQIVTPVLLSDVSQRRYELFKLQMPLSRRLLEANLLRGVLPLIPKQIVKGSSNAIPSIPDDFLERLVEPLEGATPHELKLRRILAAFAAWWDQRPLDCFVQLETLADEFPDDLDLQIEAARLAVVTEQPANAFERLDQIKTTDDPSGQQVDLARVILAAQAGNGDLVRSTARRLLARPMDDDTRTFLTKQLQSINSKNASVTSLQQAITQQPVAPTPSRAPNRRSSRNPVADAVEQIQLAQSLLESGDFITASEVAYSVIHRQQDPRKPDRSGTRRQAIQILAQTNRLQPLITTTQRKLESSPNSNVYREELADLYVAAGEPELAGRLWEQTIESEKLTPRQIIRRASSLRGKQKFHHAAMLYLVAFERDPKQWQSHWNVFTRAASMSTSQEILFDHLCRIDIRSFPLESVCSAIRIPGSGTFSEAQRRFARHVVVNHPQAAKHLDVLLAAIPKSERQQLPELKSMMVDAITSPNAFRHDSPLWSVRGWNESGVVQGVLADLMNLLHRDDQASHRFLNAVDGSTDEDTRAIRRWLKAVYELHAESTRGAAAERIRAMVPARLNDEVTTSPPVNIPAGLLWQTGQLIETLDPIDQKAMLQIGVFQAAVGNSPAEPVPSHIVGSPLDQLFRTYVKVGRSDLARRGWLERLHTWKFPRTTGVRENRQLQVAAYIAENLFDSGFPVDAAGTCRRFLDRPLVFQLARRYSQGRNHRRILETRIESAIQSVDVENSIQYVDAMRSDLLAGVQDATVDLYGTRLDALTETPRDCLFELAVRSASSTPAGREACQSLLAQLDRIAAAEERSSPNLPARLVLASVASPDTLSDLLAECLQTFPTGERMDSGPLHEFVIALTAILRSDVESADAASMQVIAQLVEIAEDNEDQAALSVLTGLSRRHDARAAR